MSANAFGEPEIDDVTERTAVEIHACAEARVVKHRSRVPPNE
jgi:hypothetical protein